VSGAAPKELIGCEAPNGDAAGAAPPNGVIAGVDAARVAPAGITAEEAGKLEKEDAEEEAGATEPGRESVPLEVDLPKRSRSAKRSLLRSGGGAADSVAAAPVAGCAGVMRAVAVDATGTAVPGCIIGVYVIMEVGVYIPG
jgi:hypothetical protein